MNFSRLISNVGMLAALATIALASYFTIGTLDETDADSSIYLPVLTKAQVQANIKITKVVYTGDDEYVEVTNLGAEPVTISYWVVRSFFLGTNWSIRFDGDPLQPGQSYRMHFGPAAVDNPPFDDVRSPRTIWFDKGDVLQLLYDGGDLRDVYCYGNFSNICK